MVKKRPVMVKKLAKKGVSKRKGASTVGVTVQAEDPQFIYKGTKELEEEEYK